MTDRGEFVQTERELWNTAKIYSITYVAEPLARCRKLISICLFGVEELGQEEGLNMNIINQNKINAIERLLQELIQLVDQNKGFMKKRNQNKLDLLKERLDEIEKVIDGISYNTTDQRTKSNSINLNPEHFNLCLNELRKIHSESILQLSDLIFPTGDEIDFDKIKRDIMEGG